MPFRTKELHNHVTSVKPVCRRKNQGRFMSHPLVLPLSPSSSLVVNLSSSLVPSPHPDFQHLVCIFFILRCCFPVIIFNGEDSCKCFNAMLIFQSILKSLFLAFDISRSFQCKKRAFGGCPERKKWVFRNAKKVFQGHSLAR